MVDPSLDTELKPIDADHVDKMFTAYRTDRGEFPHEDHEPTADQLAAVAQLVRAGVPPYVDFSVFGPHGKRMLKKIHLVANYYEPSDGTWRRVELPGPPDFEVWWKCWLVFRCTMLLLQASKPEPLDLYGELMRTMSQTYGPSCWFLIYQADVRMRSEELERIRRRAASEAHPAEFRFNWGDIFLIAVRSREFWAT